MKKGELLILMSTIVMATLMSSCLKYVREIKSLTEVNQRLIEVNTELTTSLTDIQTILDTTIQNYNEAQLQVEELQKALTNTDSDWKVVQAVATAYAPYQDLDGNQSEGLSDVTSIGLTPGPNIIAVDPAKIPYGSEMIVVYSDGTILEGIAGDTGGALRDADYILLDIFKYTFDEALAHGRQDVTLIYK